MRVDVLQRKIAKREPHAAGEPLQQQLRRRLLAVRALEITVFDERHGRMFGARDVIDRRDRDRELEVAVRRHGYAQARAAAGRPGWKRRVVKMPRATNASRTNSWVI